MKGSDPHDPVAARRAAMDLLARREHSRHELKRKLGRRFAGEALELALERLAQEGLQSDARYAESYARQRAARGFGPLKLQAELRERGVAAALTDEVLAGPEFDWAALAQAACRKKFGDGAPADLREKAKRLRFLHHRGFEGDALSPISSGIE